MLYLSHRSPGRRQPWLPLAGLLVFCLAAGPSAADEGASVPGPRPPDTALDAQRQDAVRDARSGRIGKAYRRLEALLAAHPDSRPVRLDLAVVAAWAGDDGRAVTLLESLEPESLPDYVLQAYAKATRNLGRWEQALSLYTRLAHRRPEAAEPQLARALVYADDHRIGEAREILAAVQAALPPDAPEQAEAWFVCGYIEERARRFTRALACYDRALDLDEAHTDARRRRLMTMAALGAPEKALEAARARPGLLTEAQIQRLRLDVAAMEVRWAPLPGPGTSRAHAAAALATQQSLLDEGGVGGMDTPRGRALHFDRIAALTAAGRWAEAVQGFDGLERWLETPAGRDFAAPAGDAPLDALPVYVLAAAAEASLHLERPGRAASLYRAALRRAPGRFALQAGLFYAYADLNDHPRARALAARMVDEQPPWLRPAPGHWRPNPRYGQARELSALELAYRERYDAALASFDHMLKLAPASSSLGLSRAQVLHWRGRPEAARQDVQRVRHREPENLRARLLDGELALDTHRYRRAESVLEESVRQAPEASGTLDLAARWRLHNRPEISLEAGAGRSTGSAVASRDWRMEGYYFTAPMAYRYRAFVRDQYRYARFDEGAGRHHRLGAGVEYRSPRWRWRAEVNRGLEDTDTPGAAVDGVWRVDDRLSLEARAAVESADVPLRGARAGVRGDALAVGARYRWHESREASISAGGLDTNDDNRRRWLAADVSQRVMNLPRHKLLATVRAYGSRNSETGRPYYNPVSDRELGVGVVHEWRVFRRYDRGLVQRLGLEAGDYRQEDFGSAAVWSLFLEHDWLLGARTRLRYGLRTGGRVYDGEREHQTSAFVGLEWRP